MGKGKKLKVYLAGSMAAGRDFENGVKQTAKILEDLGCKIVTKKTVVNNNEKSVAPTTLKNRKYIMRRDKEWLRGSDVVIAEVSQYSHGVGYEHAYAETQGKPILLLRHMSLNGNRHSAFLDGTDYKRFMFSFYDENNLKEVIEKFINKNDKKTP